MDGLLRADSPTTTNLRFIMNLYFTGPLLFALIALYLADENGSVFKNAYNRGLVIEDKTRIKLRLEELGRGSDRDYENFRIYQMILISSSLAVLFSLYFFDLVSLSIALACACISIPAVIFLTEKSLSKRVVRRREIIEGEFPALIEMLTLAIGAGESPSGAVKRISGRASGVLSNEFLMITKEIENGTSFTFALDNLRRKASTPIVRRFTDSMAIAISRGTPLVEILNHSVREARSNERIKMLNIAAKAEISMMIPVVFLILPISILFAMYPSMASLELFTA